MQTILYVEVRKMAFLKKKNLLLGGTGVLIIALVWLFPKRPKVNNQFLGFAKPLWLYEEEEALTDSSLQNDNRSKGDKPQSDRQTGDILQSDRQKQDRWPAQETLKNNGS